MDVTTFLKLAALVFCFFILFVVTVFVFKKRGIKSKRVVIPVYIFYLFLLFEFYVRIFVTQQINHLSNYRMFNNPDYIARSSNYVESRISKKGVDSPEAEKVLTDCRGCKISLDRDSNKVYVVLLGGSAMWGHGFNSDEPHYISAIMQKQLGDKFCVINLSNPGFVSHDELETLKEVIRHKVPVDIVISLTGWNDFIKFGNFPELNDRYYYPSIYATKTIDRTVLLRPVAFASYACRWFFYTLYGLNPDWRQYNQKYTEHHHNLIENFLSNIDQCRKICMSNGIKYSVFLQPKNLQPKDKVKLQGIDYGKYYDVTNKMYDQANAGLMSLQKTQGLNYFDLRAIFDGANIDKMYLDSCHFTEEGNLKVMNELIGKSKVVDNVIEAP